MFVYASFFVIGFSGFYLLGASAKHPEAEAETDEVDEVNTVKVVHFSPCGGAFRSPLLLKFDGFSEDASCIACDCAGEAG